MTPTGHLRRGRVAGVEATTFLSCGLFDPFVGPAEQRELERYTKRPRSCMPPLGKPWPLKACVGSLPEYAANNAFLSLAWPELKRSCLCPPNRSSSHGAIRYFRSSKRLTSSGCVVSAGCPPFPPATFCRGPVTFPPRSRSFWQERSRSAGTT